MTNNHFYYLKKIDGFLYQRLIIYITKMAASDDLDDIHPWDPNYVWSKKAIGPPGKPPKKKLPSFPFVKSLTYEPFITWLYNNHPLTFMMMVMYRKEVPHTCRHENGTPCDLPDSCEYADTLCLAQTKFALHQQWNLFARSRPSGRSLEQPYIHLLTREPKAKGSLSFGPDVKANDGGEKPRRSSVA
jgi:hypothetical protein